MQVAENGGGHGSFQAYSTEGHRHQSNSIIMNADVNDLGLASPLASPSPEQRMGSLTGWQAIAAQVRMQPCRPLGPGRHTEPDAAVHEGGRLGGRLRG